MTEENNAEPTQSAPPAKQRDVLSLVFDALASVKVALALVALIAVACVLGTVLPQDDDADKYVRAHPAAAKTVEILKTVGLTRVFQAWWFIALLCALCASLVACNGRRFAGIFRATGRLPGRAVASLVTHVSILLILAGAVIRGVWGQNGHIEFREGETVDYFDGEKGRVALPFALRLDNFEVEFHADPESPAATDSASEAIFGRLVVRWPEENMARSFPAAPDVERVVAAGDKTSDTARSFRLRVLRYVPDFVMDTATKEVISRSSEPANPAILVSVAAAAGTNRYWLFADHPEFNAKTGESHGDWKEPFQMAYVRPEAQRRSGAIKAFRSTVTILEQDFPVDRATIAVNSPFSFKKYTFYQASYDPRRPDWTALLVVRDPGVPIVYAGFALMIGGLFAVFYLYGNQESGARSQKSE